MQEEAKSPVKLTTKAVLNKKITLVETVFHRSDDPKSNWKLFGEPMVAVFNAMKSLKCKRCGEEGHREERCQYMNLLREEAVKAGKLYSTAFQQFELAQQKAEYKRIEELQRGMRDKEDVLRKDLEAQIDTATSGDFGLDWTK